MNALGAIGASALAYDALRLEVGANNVANAATDGFAASRVLGRDRLGGGVQASVTVLNTPGSSTGDHDLFVQRRSNTDIEAETVSRASAFRAFEASAAMIKVAERMAGSLFDVLA